MQFKIYSPFEVFIEKSRCFLGTGGNTASCNCQTLLWHRLTEKQLRASQFSRKDITQLTVLKMQYIFDDLVQLIGIFIMANKRQCREMGKGENCTAFVCGWSFILLDLLWFADNCTVRIDQQHPNEYCEFKWVSVNYQRHRNKAGVL